MYWKRTLSKLSVVFLSKDVTDFFIRTTAKYTTNGFDFVAFERSIPIIGAFPNKLQNNQSFSKKSNGLYKNNLLNSTNISSD